MAKHSSLTSAEQRLDTRFRTKNVTFPGRLVHMKTGTAYQFRPVDVSARGLGFFVNAEIAKGIYFLEFPDGHVNVEVIYCHGHLGIDNLFRAGLFVRDGSFSLHSLFNRLDLTLEPIPTVNPII